MKKLFLVTTLICILLNGAIIRTWIVQEASAKEKIEKKDRVNDELAVLESNSK